MKNLSFLLLVLAVIFSISCTREVEKDAKISLQFSSKSNSPSTSSTCATSVPAGHVPAHLIANVHFDGQVEKTEWDCPELHSTTGNIANCAFPSSIEFSRDFPTGGNRIVQVLLVYASEENDLSLYYGEQLNLEFVSGNNNVVISCWDEGAATENASLPQEGMVSGRILDASGNGITGSVAGLWQPASGAPAMKLFENAVFDGWFQFMFLNGPRFTWQVEKSLNPAIHDGLVLFNNKNLGDIYDQINSSSDAHAVVIHKPQMWRIFSGFQQQISFSGAPSSASDIASCATFPCGFGTPAIDGTGDMGDNNSANGLAMSSLKGVVFDFGSPKNIIGLELAFDVGSAWNVSGFVINALLTGTSQSGATQLYNDNINYGSGADTKYYDFHTVNANATQFVELTIPTVPGTRRLYNAKAYIYEYDSELSPEELDIYGHFSVNNGGSVDIVSGLGGSPSLSKINYNSSTGGVVEGALHTSAYPIATPPVDSNGVWANRGTDYPSSFVSWGGMGTPSTTEVKVLSSSAPYHACGADVSDLMVGTCTFINEEKSDDRSFAPFAGPFKEFVVELGSAPRYGLVKVMKANSSNGRKVRWQYIPNLVSNAVISGAYAFIVNKNELESFRKEEFDYPCTAMMKSVGVSVQSNGHENDSYPFIYASANVTATEGAPSEALFSTIPGGASDKDVVVCPYVVKAGQMISYNMGINAHGINHGSPPESVFFATSTTHLGSLGGLTGADTICQTAAAAGTLTASSGLTWIALLSDSSTNATDRLPTYVDFYNPSGSFMFSKSTLFNGALATPTPAYQDENGSGAVTSSEVYTGSNQSGTVQGTNHCSDWTDGTSGSSGQSGIVNASASRISNGPRTCDTAIRLFCVSVPD